MATLDTGRAVETDEGTDLSAAPLASDDAGARERALSARYGAATDLPGADWNPVLATLLDHRSVRGFSAKALPEQTLPLLVAAAQSAATSSNTQSWSVVSVVDPAKRRRLAEIAGGQRHVEEAPLFLVWIADLSRAAGIGRRQGVELGALDYTEAFLIAAIDAALAAQNAVIAAESLGLGTVYIGALRNRPAEVADLLELPSRAAAVFGLCVGYARPGAEGEVKPRLEQGAVLHIDRYEAGGIEQIVERHDERSDEFRARQGLGPIKWSAQLIDRWRNEASLMGRHVLADTLRRLGFPLK